MSAKRAVVRRRWVVDLPVVLALLLALGSAGYSRSGCESTSGGRPDAAYAAVMASAQPIMTGGAGAEARLLAQRSGWSARWVAALGSTGYRVAPLPRRSTLAATAPMRCGGGRGDPNRGRGPPARV